MVPLERLSDLFDFVPATKLEQNKLNLKSLKPALKDLKIFNIEEHSFSLWFYKELFNQLVDGLQEQVDEDEIGKIEIINCIELELFEDTGICATAYVNDDYTQSYDVLENFSKMINVHKLANLVKVISGCGETVENIYLQLTGNFEDPKTTPLFITFSTIYTGTENHAIYSHDIFNPELWGKDLQIPTK